MARITRKGVLSDCPEGEHPDTSDSELKDGITNSAIQCMPEAGSLSADAHMDAKLLNQLLFRHTR